MAGKPGALLEREGAVEESTAPSDSPPTPDMAALLLKLSDQIQSVVTRMDTLENRPQPGQIRGMDPMLNSKLGPVLNNGTRIRPGDDPRMVGLEQIPHGADSHPLGPGYPRPRFRPGDRVLVLEDVHHGTGKAHKTRIIEEDGSKAVDDEGRPLFERTVEYLTWGQVFKKVGQVRCPRIDGLAPCPTAIPVNSICPYCGHGPEILSVEFMHEDGQWAYRVRIPGMGEPYGEILVDADQRIRRGKCVCTYFRHFGMKNGPCRHMLALRWRSTVGALDAYRQSNWYNRLKGRSNGTADERR